MSYQLFKDDVLFYQRFLKAGRFYNATLDSTWGPLTNQADFEFTKQTCSIANQYGIFDQASETHIASLLPKTQVEARRFLLIAKNKLQDVRILSGTRTYEEQNSLYAHCKNGNNLPIITNARGGQSNHNFGIAWDIGVFYKFGNYISYDIAYQTFAEIVLPLFNTIEWGGNWISFKDFPHYQLKSITGDVGVIRGLFEGGSTYV